MSFGEKKSVPIHITRTLDSIFCSVTSCHMVFSLPYKCSYGNIRSSILERAQTRLAKLDELRKAAKAELETRFERERDELSAKVQSRAKQAEENRSRFLKACSQRSSARRDRITQLITQKTIKERKYRDRVRASICQKRAAAVRKRSRFLEEEKAKACAMILRVRQAVNSASSEQVMDR